MGKQIWRPGNMVYPLPAVMVTSVDSQGKPNIMTAAWTGTICSDLDTQREVQPRTDSEFRRIRDQPDE